LAEVFWQSSFGASLLLDGLNPASPTRANPPRRPTACFVSECAEGRVQLLIVNLPAWFKDEQEKANGGQCRNGEADKKRFHELRSKSIEWLRMIVPTDGSSCLLLSGAFGKSPFSWQPSGGT
jgi:hypothetical protein